MPGNWKRHGPLPKREKRLPVSQGLLEHLCSPERTEEGKQFSKVTPAMVTYLAHLTMAHLMCHPHPRHDLSGTASPDCRPSQTPWQPPLAVLKAVRTGSPTSRVWVFRPLTVLTPYSPSSTVLRSAGLVAPYSRRVTAEAPSSVQLGSKPVRFTYRRPTKPCAPAGRGSCQKTAEPA